MATTATKTGKFPFQDENGVGHAHLHQTMCFPLGMEHLEVMDGFDEREKIQFRQKNLVTIVDGC
jgi:hypothetical protein